MPFDGTENPRVAMLERARAILHRRGWGQGAMYKRDGKVCLVAAIREASGRNWDYVLGPYPAEWNDEPGRTLADIDAWIDERIAEAL